MVVGTIGFVVDTCVLYAMTPLVGLYAGRFISFILAVAVTWVLNRTWTFSIINKSRSIKKELFAYLLLMGLGGLVNYFVFVAFVMNVDIGFEYPVLGVALGSIAGMSVNFSTSRVLFKS